MDNIVTITTAHKNELEFDLSIEGLSDSDAVVHFVIKTSEYDLSFPCSRNGAKWEVTIPALHTLEQTMYPFSINVVCDGYFFTPLTGQVNAAPDAQVYASVPEKPSIKPSMLKQNDDKVEDTPIEVVKTEESKRPIKSIKSAMSKFKAVDYAKNKDVGVTVEDSVDAIDKMVDKIIANKKKLEAPVEEAKVEEIEPVKNEVVGKVEEPEEVVEEVVVEQVEEIVVEEPEEIVEEIVVEQVEEPEEIVEEVVEEIVKIVDDGKVKDIIKEVKETKPTNKKKNRVTKKIKGTKQKLIVAEKVVPKPEPIVELSEKDKRAQQLLREMEESKTVTKKNPVTAEKFVPKPEPIVELSEKDKKTQQLLSEIEEPDTTNKDKVTKKKVKVTKKKGIVAEKSVPKLEPVVELSEKDTAPQQILSEIEENKKTEEKKNKKAVKFAKG